jgi:hypothetical protein
MQHPDEQLPAVLPIGFVPAQRQTTEHLRWNRFVRKVP